MEKKINVSVSPPLFFLFSVLNLELYKGGAKIILVTEYNYF